MPLESRIVACLGAQPILVLWFEQPLPDGYTALVLLLQMRRC